MHRRGLKVLFPACDSDGDAHEKDEAQAEGKKGCTSRVEFERGYPGCGIISLWLVLQVIHTHTRCVCVSRNRLAVVPPQTAALHSHNLLLFHSSSCSFVIASFAWISLTVPET